MARSKHPRGQLLMRCGSIRTRMLRLLLIVVPLGFAPVVVIGGLITGYWGFMLGLSALMLIFAMPIFLFTFRPVAVYENGIVAGSFRRWNEIASIQIWEYGMVSVMQRRTMSVWGKFEESVEFQVPPESVDELHDALRRAYPGPLERRGTPDL